jgi:hypothetical protein
MVLIGNVHSQISKYIFNIVTRAALPPQKTVCKLDQTVKNKSNTENTNIVTDK